MFLISYSIFTFSDLGMFQTNNGIGIPNNIELNSTIVDDLHVKQDTSLAFTTEKDTWLPSTVALAQFINDLHCGNFTLNGLEISELRFKKRKKNELQWITFYTTPFSKDINTYETIDCIVEASEEYEYGVAPATSTIEGDMKILSIVVNFNGTFLSDKNSYYKLIYNLEMGDINFNQQNSIIETLNGVYPIIMCGVTNYKTGSIRCRIVSESTVLSGGKIDVQTEKSLRKQIMSFLTNRKPKVYKDNSGNFMMINIISTPKLTPLNPLNQLIYDLSFEFVESGDIYDSNTLLSSGLI